MKHIYMTETELTFTKTDNCVDLGYYSKEKLLELIGEFPDLKHPLKVYRFLYHTGEVFSTVNLTDFARQNDLDASTLSKILRKPGTLHKGLMKCPEEGITSSLENNRDLYIKAIKGRGNNSFNRFVPGQLRNS